MAKVFAIANQKGGVGKTTTSVSLAAALRTNKKRVLLIDTDPQCNSTDTYRAKVQNETTLYDVFKERISIREAIQKTAAGDIVASDKLLEDADQLFTQQGREYILREALEEIQGEYDYIIIDTPPRLGVMLSNALTAANSVIIAVVADRYSLQGLSELLVTIKNCRKYANKHLQIEGLLLTMFNARTNLSKDVLSTVNQIAEKFETKVFTTQIRASVAAKEAQTNQQTIFDYAPYSTTGLDYAQFAKEIGGTHHE